MNQHLTFARIAVLVSALLLCVSLSASAGTVTITSPASGATVSSPVHFVASATSSYPVTAVRIYLDYVSAYTVFNTGSLDTYLSVATGTHNLTVNAWDSTGAVFKSSLNFTVGTTSTSTSTSTISPKISVSISPTSASLSSGQTQQFTGTVSGTTKTSIIWQVNGVNGGSSTYGTISSTGLYTAPTVSTTSTFTVTAKSYYDSTKYANATVTVAPAATGTSSGSNYYVSTSGSDSNPGTATAPWRTIQHAASVAKPGMVIHVAGGTYTGSINATVSGTSTARIRFISDVQWAAKVVGNSGSSYPAWQSKGNYIDIVGFDVTSNSTIGIMNLGSYVGIIGNHVHNLPTNGCTSTGGAGIDNGNYYASDNDIIGNVVHDIGTPGTCQRIQGIYHSNLRGHILNNLSYGNAAWGIHLWHAASHVTISGNTVFNNGIGGVVIGDGDSPGGVVDDYTVVTNNIVAYNHGYGIYELGATGTHNQYVNNLLYSNGNNLRLLNGLTASGTIYASPMFVNYTGDSTGNYQLQSASPACSGGTYVAAPNNDIRGGPRPWSSAWSIGAYEWNSPPATWPWM